jgi:hypothetical protein
VVQNAHGLLGGDCGLVDNTGGVREAQGEIWTCQGEDRANTPPRETPLGSYMDTWVPFTLIYLFIYSFSLRVIVLVFSL